MTNKSERLFLIICSLFSVLLVLSNMITAKICCFPFTDCFALPAGLITYPLTFLVTDTVTEIWGEKRARLMILVALAMNVLSLAVVQISLWLPADPNWVVPNNPYDYADVAAYQNAYESVFGVNHVMIFGSIIAYLVSQLLDVSIFAMIRSATGSRHLWLRNNASTLLSQAFDTLITGFFFFYIALGMDLATALPLLVQAYLYKAIFSLIDTPFLYLSVNRIRAYIGEEVA